MLDCGGLALRAMASHCWRCCSASGPTHSWVSWRLLSSLLVHSVLAFNRGSSSARQRSAASELCPVMFYLVGGIVGELAGIRWQPVGAGNSVATFAIVGALMTTLVGTHAMAPSLRRSSPGMDAVHRAGDFWRDGRRDRGGAVRSAQRLVADTRERWTRLRSARHSRVERSRSRYSFACVATSTVLHSSWRTRRMFSDEDR